MSTSYNILDSDSLGIGGLYINESSNTLSLATIQDDEDILKLTPYIAPEDLMRIFLKGITVCSYWMDSATFKKILDELEDYSF